MSQRGMSKQFVARGFRVEDNKKDWPDRQDGPLYAGRIDEMMYVCSKLFLLSDKDKNREYRVREIKRQLVMHQVVVYMLGLILNAELGHDRTDGRNCNGNKDNDHYNHDVLDDDSEDVGEGAGGVNTPSTARGGGSEFGEDR